MALGQERMKVKQRAEVESWSIKEQLCLAGAVLRSGDQNWMAVSRMLRPFGDPSRLPDWYSQKNCAVQYSSLLENVETPKRKKRNEKGESQVETPSEAIVRKLAQERIEELKQIMQEKRAEFMKLKDEAAQVKNGYADDRLDELCQQIDEEKRQKEKMAEAHAIWLKEREKMEVDRAWKPPVTPAFPHRRKFSRNVARRNSNQSDPSSEAESAQDSPLSEPLNVDVINEDTSESQIEVKPPPATPTSPLLTSLLKSPSPAPVSQNSSILHTAITSHRGSSPTITSLLNSAPGIPVSSNAVTVAPPATVSSSLKNLVSSAISGAGSDHPPTHTTSPAAGAPTLSMLLELPPSLPGKPLPELPSAAKPTHTPPSTLATVSSANEEMCHPQHEELRVRREMGTDEHVEVVEVDLAKPKEEPVEVLIEEAKEQLDEGDAKEPDSKFTESVIDDEQPSKKSTLPAEEKEQKPTEDSSDLDPGIQKVTGNEDHAKEETPSDTCEKESELTQETNVMVVSEETQNEQNVEVVPITEADLSKKSVEVGIKEETEETVQAELVGQVVPGQGDLANMEETILGKSQELDIGDVSRDELEDASVKESTDQSEKNLTDVQEKEILKERDKPEIEEPKEGTEKESKATNNLMKDSKSDPALQCALKKDDSGTELTENVSVNDTEQTAEIAHIEESIEEKSFQEPEEKNIPENGSKMNQGNALSNEDGEELPKQDLVEELREDATSMVSKRKDISSLQEVTTKDLPIDELCTASQKDALIKDTASRNPNGKDNPNNNSHTDEIKKDLPPEDVKSNRKNDNKEVTKKDQPSKASNSKKESLKEVSKKDESSKEKSKKESSLKGDDKTSSKEIRSRDNSSKEETRVSKTPSRRDRAKPNHKKEGKGSVNKKDTKNDSSKKDSRADSRKKEPKSGSHKRDLKEDNHKRNTQDDHNNKDEQASREDGKKPVSKENLDKSKEKEVQIKENSCKDIPLLDSEVKELSELSDKKPSKETKKREVLCKENTKESSKKDSSKKESSRKESSKKENKEEKEQPVVKEDSVKTECVEESADEGKGKKRPCEEDSISEVPEVKKKIFEDEDEKEEDSSCVTNETKEEKGDKEINECDKKDERNVPGSPEDMKSEDNVGNTDEKADKVPIVRPETPSTEDEKTNDAEPTRGTGKKRFGASTPSDSVPNSPAASITDEERENRVWKKSIMLVYGRLATHKYASLFLRPITDDQAPGYSSLVHRPIDLLMIKKNIETGVTRTNIEFQRDVMLMFCNSIMYNKSSHFVHRMASQMQEECLQHIQDFLTTQMLVQSVGETPHRRETRTTEANKHKDNLSTPGSASQDEGDNPTGGKRKRLSESDKGSKKRKVEDSRDTSSVRDGAKERT